MNDLHGDEEQIRLENQQRKLDQEEFALYQSQLGDADAN